MFDKNLEELKELHNNSQELVDQKFNSFMVDLKNTINNDNNKIGIFSNLGIHGYEDILLMIIVYIMIVAFGLYVLFPDHLESLGLYIFGLVFFAAGFSIGISNAKGFGLIFLFSHGGSGFGIMASALLEGRYNTNLLTDLSSNMKLYLGVIIALLIMAVLGTVVYNLSDTWKTNKSNKILLLLLFFAALILIGLFPVVNF